MKLLVRNLDRSTTADDLRPLFEAFGPIQSCVIVMDAASGQSKGFGFVEMPNAGHAKAAIKSLNGAKVGASNIRVKKAEDKPAQ